MKIASNCVLISLRGSTYLESVRLASSLTAALPDRILTNLSRCHDEYSCYSKRCSQDVVDTFGQPLRSLRLSVTDRCNLRCAYCMPEEEYVWLPREDVLTFEEMALLAGYFTDLGVDKVRLTGGEPLLRRISRD